MENSSFGDQNSERKILTFFWPVPTKTLTGALQRHWPIPSEPTSSECTFRQDRFLASGKLHEVLASPTVQDEQYV